MVSGPDAWKPSSLVAIHVHVLCFPTRVDQTLRLEGVFLGFPSHKGDERAAR